jgi:predicted DNA-binding protein
LKSSSPPLKTITVSLRLTPAVKNSLDRIAKADGRTTTSLTKKIIEDWLKAQGGKK